MAKRITCADLEKILKTSIQSQQQLNQQLAAGLTALNDGYAELKKVQEDLVKAQQSSSVANVCRTLIEIGKVGPEKASISVLNNRVNCEYHVEGPSRGYSLCRLTIKDGKEETGSPCPFSGLPSYLNWLWGN